MSATISDRCAAQSRPALRSTSSNSSRSRRRPSTRSLAQRRGEQNYRSGMSDKPGNPQALAQTHHASCRTNLTRTTSSILEQPKLEGTGALQDQVSQESRAPTSCVWDAWIRYSSRSAHLMPRMAACCSFREWYPCSSLFSSSHTLVCPCSHAAGGAPDFVSPLTWCWLPGHVLQSYAQSSDAACKPALGRSPTLTDIYDAMVE